MCVCVCVCVCVCIYLIYIFICVHIYTFLVFGSMLTGLSLLIGESFSQTLFKMSIWFLKEL